MATGPELAFPLLGAGLAGVVVTSFATPACIGILTRFKMIDLVIERSSHSSAVPRGGGVAVTIGIASAVAVGALTGVVDSQVGYGLGAIAAFAALGLADDIRSLPAGLRLGLQGLMAVGTVALLGAPEVSNMQALDFALAVLWIVSVVNAFNFMDGINGISGAMAVVAATAIGVATVLWGEPAIAVLAVAIGASAIGFLPFNFPTAQIFLGDVGSYALGAGLAVLALMSASSGAPLRAVVAPVGLYASDVAWTLCRRAHRRQPLMKAHRQHIYQRLANDAGWGHARTTTTVAVLAAMISLHSLASAGAGSNLALATVGIITAAATVIWYLTLPSLVLRPTPARPGSQELAPPDSRPRTKSAVEDKRVLVNGGG